MNGLAKLTLAGAALCLAGAPARAQQPPLERVISSVTLDFNNDAKKDRALLVENDDQDADLMIWLSSDDPKSDRDMMRLALVKKSIVTAGPMWGQEPSLVVNGKGSLLVKSQNMAIGRSKWERALTVAYRNGEFQVVGFTFSVHDGLDPKAGGSCDINLVTGKGTRNNKPVSLKPGAIRLADWTEDRTPKECEF